MKGILLLVLVLLAAGQAASAQARWCDVTGRGANDTIVYPPIAKAARVYGLVMGYLKFNTDGKVTGFEPIQGPAMLRESLRLQLSTWTLQTKATGTEPCQTLVVARFDFCAFSTPCEDDPTCKTESTVRLEPSILWIQERSQLGGLCCPGGALTYGNPFHHAWYSTRHAFRKLFHRSR